MNGENELDGWSLDFREREEDLRPEEDTDEEVRCRDPGWSRSNVRRRGVSEKDCLGVFAAVDGLDGLEGVVSGEKPESANEIDVCLCRGT